MKVALLIISVIAAVCAILGISITFSTALRNSKKASLLSGALIVLSLFFYMITSIFIVIIVIELFS